MSSPLTESTRATRFLRACRKQPVDTVPIWVMRQAGRYLPEYRAVRATTDFMGLCKTPDLATEVTLQPIRRLGVDAAILFSDILVPLEPMGLHVTIKEAEGPRILNPIANEADIARLVVPDPTEGTGYVMAAIRQIRKALNGEVPLIGFAGAPFTLAAYAVEGQGKKGFTKLKRLLFERPDLADALFTKLADTVTAYLLAQVEAGAQVIQIFDSWGGLLGREDFERHSLPHLTRIVQAVKRTGVPVIVFGTEMGHLLEGLASTGADVVGIDWRTDPAEARRRIPHVAIQGNLDPTALFMPKPALEARVAAILKSAGSEPGHIFNLGHGILPEVDPAQAEALVEMVHRLGRRSAP